jgi:mRNA interferase MazF
LTLSPQAYNRKSGLALFCPVRSRAKGYSFEVVIPPGPKIEGVILVDQIRSIDWVARGARPAGRASRKVVGEVLAKAAALLA